MVEGNGTSIVLYRMEAGRRFEPHEHPFPELGVVLVGRGRATMGSEERTLQEGDSFYIPAGTTHGFEVVSRKPVVMLNVTVPLLPDVAGPPPSLVVGMARKFLGNGPVSSGSPA